MTYHLICKYCSKLFKRNRKTYKYCCRRCAYDDWIGKPRHPNSGRKRTKKPTKFTCKYCGDRFERFVRPSSKNTFQFCSPICRNKARAKPSIPCPVCNEPFKQIKPNRMYYCSQFCSAIASTSFADTIEEYNQIRQTVKKLYPAKGVDYLADILGIEKDTIQNMAYNLGVKLDEDIYRDRVHKAAKKYMTGPANPNWQGGVTYKEFGSNWAEQRQRALIRDDYTCQVCFEFGNTVHHITPRRKFDKHIEKANDLSNLITLCSKHHVPVELGKIPCPIPAKED